MGFICCGMRVPSRETHDARIGGGWELKLCRGFSGEEEAEVEIEYDGVVPSGAAWGFSDLSDPKVHPISITVIDRDGNRAGIRFDLWEVSRQHQATFELAEEVHSVAFVPGGTRLASGSGEGIELWDLETQAVTTTSLSGGATAVALSHDGATLASGSGREIQLLDMASGMVVATLSGHTQPIRSLAFSPDGTILASGAADAIRLWDLAARTNTATLPAGAASVAFSPDGATLASGSEEGARLWDVARQREVATYRHSGGRRVNAVAFSPDGTLVASGGDDAAVRLWNAASGEEVAVLEGHDRPVRAVAFSTDGTLLASGADLGVSLWDPVTKGRLAALQGYGRGINTLAFSPDRTTLAAGTGDGKVGLWDVSEWLQPRPRTLMGISGDDQRGTAGSALANPCVVEVRDQYDSPLQGVEVTFAVTEGDGTLSERYTLEKVTTGADGRAEALLTLGPDPGTNTVEVSIPGVELVTFSAVGVGTPSIPLMEDEFQRWHLPDGSIARLGKGRIGRGDRVVAFSPDGRLLAVGSETGTWLYDVTTSREVALFPIGKCGHAGWRFPPMDPSSPLPGRSGTWLQALIPLSKPTIQQRSLPTGPCSLWEHMTPGSFCGTWRRAQLPPPMHIEALSTQWRFPRTAQSSLRGTSRAGSFCGTWRPGLMKPWRGIRTRFTRWHFRPTGGLSLPDPTTTRSDFGMSGRALISPRSRDIRVGFSPWRFPPMEKPLHPLRGMALSDCGTWRRGPVSLPSRDIQAGSDQWPFHLTEQPSLPWRMGGQSDCGRWLPVMPTPLRRGTRDG